MGRTQKEAVDMAVKLIKEAEWCSGESCPWCAGWSIDGHYDYCPAKNFLEEFGKGDEDVGL